ncbi:3-dehydro-L-gulonate 2-dehydrogenase [candidate division KSB1 bacterium]|nr:3-dehydro-L-gulonate 2-dehydrogenase [candidate division KSB1 bacterium]
MPDKRFPFASLTETLESILTGLGFSDSRAQRIARIFVENNRDGVMSHGLNRFPRFVGDVQGGYIDPEASPVCMASLGALEQWDGRLGPGLLNAEFAMQRAIDLSKTHGVGCVGLRNTNHWMRAGYYGWQAAKAGCVAMCWTNTEPNMPAWGGKDGRIGNNPMVMAIPRPGGHVVLDMAMSQFSYGKLEITQQAGQQLPIPGGFNAQGQLTTDPGEIQQTRRVIPIGYWKGSALSIALDMAAALLSGGEATYQIGQRDVETNLSQVYLCIDAERLTAGNESDFLNTIIDDLHRAIPASEQDRIYYPGERTLETRRYNEEHGIPVNEETWNTIQGLAKEINK